jgi:hypothetical protein
MERRKRKILGEFCGSENRCESNSTGGLFLVLVGNRVYMYRYSVERRYYSNTLK